MINWIDVRDFLIVKQAELSFGRGLTVITGETGAGKSVIVDALAILLGSRTSAEIIRSDCEACELQAGFELSQNQQAREWLDQHDLGTDAAECTLRRLVYQEKPSRGFINGRPVPIQSLRELGPLLVDIHGQHEYHLLLKKPVQRATLDTYAGIEEEVRHIAHTYDELTQSRDLLQNLRAEAERSKQQEDYLRHQVDELTELNPDPTELDSLNASHTRLSHVRELVEGTWQIQQELDEAEDGAVSTLLARATSRLSELEAYDPQLRDCVSQLESIMALLTDTLTDLRRCRTSYEHDPEEFERLDARLTLLHDTARKYRVNPDGLHQELDRVSRALEAAMAGEKDIQDTERRIGSLEKDYDELAARISQARTTAAARLGSTVTAQLTDLGLEQAVFSVELAALDQDRAGRYGMESVDFQVRTIADRDMASLDQVASGGELSRISLAVQVVTSAIDSVPSCIYDEVDIGIGGRIAEIVGSKLRELGAERQILCITHLPQVAVQGRGHLLVTKSGQSDLKIDSLDRQSRTEEIARMLGGIEITQQTRAHAEEMLQRAMA
ncbi:MAG: DNA repair protein RecN [Arenicellales bacterium]|jgi:DNA repair protein RecN (Recombination protein N)|nr:DNA repair protein RecN [Acidiferrobacteraceae bacterium]MDP6135507.1 DNA repair protein RecN [Arenicellales bacterium]HCF73722.1 DNA repair protein RecN [Gammaproteobacteria bacterium]MDP6392027.1 DNA repair protein RecN [Arenicellales bacterium]MDP7219728.1 DNA repair protein RecN [Arenicellales bacterium]|tara:strand:+ start:9239 stop:10906 length:1668 start_codon:yes stop_codon:yes gene_type:complete